MTTIKIEASIDVTNAAHVAAAIVFMQTIGNVAATQEEKKLNIFEKKLAEKKSAELPKKEAAKTEEVKETPAAEAAKEKAPKEEKTPAKEATTSGIKIEEVRALLAKKVNDHRDAIKTKLTELGASSVTTLEVDKYEAFTTFLNSL